MRRAVAGLAAGVVLAVSACGGGAEPPPSDQGADPAQVSGEITWWDTSDATNEAPAFKKLVEDFEKKYPKIKVNYVNVPFDEAQNKFKTAAQSQSGDAPDVIRAEVAWTPEFASLGYLQPLDGTSALDSKAGFLDVSASSTKLNGKTWAVPQVTDTLALLYNRKLLKAAGHEEPPATFDDLKQVALDVKSKTDAEGFAINVQGYFWLPFLYGQGGDLLDVSAKKVTADSPPAAAAMNQVLDLVDSGAAAKPTLQDSYDNVQTAFKAGKVAMIFNGPWSIADDHTGKAFKDDKENLGIAPIPAGPAGQGAPVGGHNYAIYAGSSQLDASYLFVRFMSSPRSQAKIAEELGLLPASRPAYDDPKVAENAIVKAFEPVIAKAVERPWIPEGGLLFEPLDKTYQEIIGRQGKPEAELAELAEEYRGVLKDWS